MPIVSVSINEGLLEELDRVQEALGYSGRSEVIRAAVRLLLTDSREKQRISGAVNALLLSLHPQDTEHHVTQIKGRYLDVIHTQLHNRFDSGKCMELFILDGDADRIRELAAELQHNEDNEYVKLILI